MPQQWLPIRWNSFFVKLFGGFLIIIVLLLSFNALTFSFFRNMIAEEMVDNNSLYLQHTFEKYETQLKLVNTMLIRFYTLDSLASLVNDNNELNYYTANEIKIEMNSYLSNEMLYLEDLIVLFRNNDQVLTSEGIFDSAFIFSRYYKSQDYDPDFWKQQFTDSDPMQILPASQFTRYNFNQTITQEKLLLPVVVKHTFNDAYLIIAFLNVGSMQDAFHKNKETLFWIYGNNPDRPLFASRGALAASEDTIVHPPIMSILKTPTSNGHLHEHDRYFFHVLSEQTGLTYIDSVSDLWIKLEVQRLNRILYILLAGSLGISLIISIIMSLNVNRPIQNIVQYVQRVNRHPHAAVHPPSNIHEFDTIRESVDKIMHDQLTKNQELTKQSTLLRDYGYIVAMKSLFTKELKEWTEPDEQMYLILFQMMYTPKFQELGISDQLTADRYIKEYINVHFKSRLPESITLQMERNQVLTLISEIQEVRPILQALEELKYILDHDTQYCVLTIACYPLPHTPAQISIAYEAAQSMLQQRLLIRETQIITEVKLERALSFLPSALEKEMLASLQSGETDKVIAKLFGMLDRMQENHTTAVEIVKFSKGIVTEVYKVLTMNQIDYSSVIGVMEQQPALENCIVPDDMKQVLAVLIKEAALLFEKMKQESDPIKDYMLDYINKHFSKDISIEEIADRLNLSRGYLSKYFHEKMGVTFIDYLNDIRIEHAKELLMQKDLLVQDISLAVGYQNVNSFIRMFKRSCGLTPGEFRKQALQSNET